MYKKHPYKEPFINGENITDEQYARIRDLSEQDKKRRHFHARLTELSIAGFFLKEAQAKGFDYALKLLAYERARANHSLAEIEHDMQQEKVKQAKTELDRCSAEYRLILPA